MNTNNLLHVNTVLTHNTNNSIIQMSEKQLTGAGGLTRPRDSRCAEASITQPPSFVRRILLDLDLLLGKIGIRVVRINKTHLEIVLI